MLMRDLLLHLSSYPEATPGWAVLAAISAADAWDARLSVALGHVHVPRVSIFLADAMVDAKKAIAAENAKSDRQAEALAWFTPVVGRST